MKKAVVFIAVSVLSLSSLGCSVLAVAFFPWIIDRDPSYRYKKYYKDPGEISITDIAIAKDRMVIEIERKGRPIDRLYSSADIRYADIPNTYLRFATVGGNFQVKEEQHGRKEWTMTMTLDLTDVDTAVFDEKDDPAGLPKKNSVLYTNKEAVLIIWVRNGSLMAAQIFASIVIDENGVHILGQKVYKPYAPHEPNDSVYDSIEMFMQQTQSAL